MRTRSFIGVLLVVGGGLLLLNSLGLLPVDLSGVWFPLLILAIGVWILLGNMLGPRSAETEDLTIPLESAGSAKLRLRHGAGRIRLDAGEPGSLLLSGQFGGGVESRIRRKDDRLEVDLSVPGDRWMDFLRWRGGFAWTLDVNPEVPLEIDLQTGAGEASLQLDELQVRRLRVSTGAGSTAIRLPMQAGHTDVTVQAGAAEIDLRVPDGVAAQVRARQGLTAIKVDERRFPRSGDQYLSTDFSSAENRVAIDIQAGVGSIRIS